MKAKLLSPIRLFFVVVLAGGLCMCAVCVGLVLWLWVMLFWFRPGLNVGCGGICTCSCGMFLTCGTRG